jgi:hypothetical protein
MLLINNIVHIVVRKLKRLEKDMPFLLLLQETLKVIILTFFKLLQIVVASQASQASPEVVKFASAPIPTLYVIDIVADLKYYPLRQCLKCCQCTNVFNVPHCSRCCENA